MPRHRVGGAGGWVPLSRHPAVRQPPNRSLTLLRPQVLRRPPARVEAHADVTQELSHRFLTNAATFQCVVDLVDQVLPNLNRPVEIRAIEIGPGPRL